VNEVARVGERVITAEEFIQRLVEREKQHSDPDMRTATAALDSLIIDEMFRLEQDRLEAWPKRNELEDEFNRVIARWKEDFDYTNSKVDPDYTWEEYTKAKTGLSVPEFEATIREQSREVVGRRLVVNYWILSTDSADVEGLKMKNKEELLKIRTRLLSGEELAPIARKYSEDPHTRANDGKVGTVYIDDGSMEPEVAKALWELKAGDWSGAIPAAEGYFWLVRKAKFYPGNKAEFFNLRKDCFDRVNPTYAQFIQWRHAIASSGRYAYERRMPGWDVQAGE
jgi:hypothetical protein